MARKSSHVEKVLEKSLNLRLVARGSEITDLSCLQIKRIWSKCFMESINDECRAQVPSNHGDASTVFLVRPEFFPRNYVLPMLPLRPGPYTWQLSLYDEHGLVELWECVPELVVSTAPVTHPRDEWSGILNIPAEFYISPVGDSAA